MVEFPILSKFVSSTDCPSGTLQSIFFHKTLILAFEAKSALFCKNETKIMKITHSADTYPNTHLKLEFFSRFSSLWLCSKIGRQNLQYHTEYRHAIAQLIHCAITSALVESMLLLCVSWRKLIKNSKLFERRKNSKCKAVNIKYLSMYLYLA